MHRSKPDARIHHATLSAVNGQRPIEALAGLVRLAPYLREAGDDEAKAARKRTAALRGIPDATLS